MWFCVFFHGRIREGREEAVVGKGGYMEECRVGGETGSITINHIMGEKDQVGTEH